MNAVREFADIIEKHRVFVLTGAGVSAESGIRTFRDECDRIAERTPDSLLFLNGSAAGQLLG